MLLCRGSALALTINILLRCVVELHVELDEKQHLVLDSREEVVLPNEIKDVWSPKPEEVGKSLGRLVVEDEPGSESQGSEGKSRAIRQEYSQFG